MGCFVCRKKKSKEKNRKNEREAAADVESDDSKRKRKTPAEIAFKNSKHKKVRAWYSVISVTISET